MTTVTIGDLRLECGDELRDVEQRVTIFGSGAKTVLVCHALTGSSQVDRWWPEIAGQGGLFGNPRYRVACVNVLGSCYGSTGPSTTRGPFGRVSVGDMVRAQARALEALGVGEIDVVIGGSLGGMQALQWALDRPLPVRQAIVVAAHDHHSPLGIALNAVQREAIAIDPTRGLRLARKIAMLSYKSDELLRDRHAIDVEGYLERRASEFTGRMDAATYETLTYAMDSFDVRDRTGASPKTPLTFVGISHDWLFRPAEIRDAADRFARAGHEVRYLALESRHGHDAFLAEAGTVARILEGTVR